MISLCLRLRLPLPDTDGVRGEAAQDWAPMKKHVFHLLLATLIGCASAAAAAASEPSSDQAFELALEAQSHRDYAQMLHWLRSAARREHRAAQEMLGVVLLQGSSLFGPQVARDACAAREWLARAAEQGSEIGRMHRNLLNRQRALLRC